MKKVQRIKLQPVGSPLKLDATVIACSADARYVKVEFDGPLEDLELYAISSTEFASNMVGKDGEPTTDYRMAVKCQEWRVL